MSLYNPAGPGGNGIAAGYATANRYNVTVGAGQTYDTSTDEIVYTAGYPRISFYVLVVAGAAGATVLEQVCFDALQGGGPRWNSLQNSYAAPLNQPMFNGAATGHAPPAIVACIAARMRIVAGVDALTLEWYISATV